MYLYIKAKCINYNTVNKGQEEVNMNPTIFSMVASLLMIISFFMKDIRKLRIVITISSFIFIIFAIMIGDIPMIVMNTIGIIINIYRMIK